MMIRRVKDPAEEVEAFVARNADALLGDTAEAGHITDERFALLAEGAAPLTAEERAHVARCSECAAVVGELFEARGAAPKRRRRPAHWARRAAAVGLIAAATAAVLVFAPRDELRSKGSSEVRSADVALLAIGPDGKRDLRTGDTIRPGEQIGFKYGNTEGAHRTLTIAGWDGRRMHWYYPESAAGAAEVIRGGDDAKSVRLAFDIKVDDDYQPGALRIVAAFDASPADVEAALRAKDPNRLEHAQVFDVHVEAP